MHRSLTRDELTYRQSMARLVGASLHCSGHHGPRTLLRDRVALDRATIAGMDVDDHRLFETRAAMSGDHSNV